MSTVKRAFEKELEHRVNQINKYTTVEDLKELYDAKLWKHAKSLAAKTASRERLDFYDFIQNPLSSHGIVGNNLVYSRGSNRYNNTHTYEPIASQIIDVTAQQV